MVRGDGDCYTSAAGVVLPGDVSPPSVRPTDRPTTATTARWSHFYAMRRRRSARVAYRPGWPAKIGVELVSAGRNRVYGVGRRCRADGSRPWCPPPSRRRPTETRFATVRDGIIYTRTQNTYIYMYTYTVRPFIRFPKLTVGRTLCARDNIAYPLARTHASAPPRVPGPYYYYYYAWAATTIKYYII